jgi:hypothetical protein
MKLSKLLSFIRNQQFNKQSDKFFRNKASALTSPQNRTQAPNKKRIHHAILIKQQSELLFL